VALEVDGDGRAGSIGGQGFHVVRQRAPTFGGAGLVRVAVDDAVLPLVEVGGVGGVGEYVLRGPVDRGAGRDRWLSAALAE
jgi:hypothetical protein